MKSLSPGLYRPLFNVWLAVWDNAITDKKSFSQHVDLDSSYARLHFAPRSIINPVEAYIRAMLWYK